MYALGKAYDVSMRVSGYCDLVELLCGSKRELGSSSFSLGGSEGFQLCSSHLNCSKIISYSFNPGSCKIVRVQEKLYVETRARKPEWGGYPDTSGARWRKFVGALRRRHLSQYLFNKINHSCVKCSQRNFPGIKHIIVKFLRLFNLSYHVVSLCEIKLQSIKIIFEGGLSSCDFDYKRGEV